MVANVNLTEDEFKELTIVVLTNLEKLTNGYEIIGQINAFEKKGAQSKEEILKSLKYTFNLRYGTLTVVLFRCGECSDITR